MRVLLTNDDGIEGEGLRALASAFFKAGYDVVVVAPDCNNSAVSHYGSDDYEFSFGPRPVPDDGEKDTRLYREGYITVTPLRLNMTDDALLERWKP